MSSHRSQEQIKTRPNLGTSVAWRPAPRMPRIVISGIAPTSFGSEGLHGAHTAHRHDDSFGTSSFSPSSLLRDLFLSASFSFRFCPPPLVHVPCLTRLGNCNAISVAPCKADSRSAYDHQSIDAGCQRRLGGTVSCVHKDVNPITA